MTVVVNKIPRANFVLDKDGPAPCEFWTEDSAGLAQARAATLTCVIVHDTTTLNKTVGSGITLSTYGGVADSYVTLQLTSAEIAAFKIGAFTTYEFREGASDPKDVILKGRLVLE